MVDLDAFLKCEEHKAPYLISILKKIREKKNILWEFTVICPVDQQLNTLSLDISDQELESLSLPLGDKIFRCEKCFREAEILDVVIEKLKVSIFVSCVEHGRLITREISSDIYDKIKFAWDMKDVRVEEEKTY